VRSTIEAAIARHDCAYWLERFKGSDVCVEVIQDVAAAMRDPHFVARGVWDRKLKLKSGKTIPALPVPITREFVDATPRGYPSFGSDSADDADLWQRD
jgi:crotonobetainyl-CoA:carnitine CoA-transferase CaiB-like acyl-CoA transferase